jgi:hypothetical protein
MGMSISKAGNVNLSDGEVVISQGQEVQALYILTVGKLELLRAPTGIPVNSDDLLIKKSCRLGYLGQNSFPGVQSLFTGQKAHCTYRAVGPCTIYAAPMQSEQQLQGFMSGKPDHALALASTLMMTIDTLAQTAGKLQRIFDPLATITENAGVYFWRLKNTVPLSASPDTGFFVNARQNTESVLRAGTAIPDHFDADFMEGDHSALFHVERLPERLSNSKQVEYYRRVVRLAPPVRKAFLTTDPAINFYVCQDMADCLSKNFSDLNVLIDRFEDLFAAIYTSDSDEGLFTEYGGAILEVIRRGRESTAPSEIVDYLKLKIRTLLQDFAATFGKEPGIDYTYFERTLQQSQGADFADESSAGASPGTARSSGGDASLSGEAASQGSTESSAAPVDISSLPGELRGSLKRILDYSGLLKDKTDAFTANVERFRKLKDKSSPDDAVRKLRRALSTGFFEIYEAVFKRMADEGSSTRLYDMFIDFGFMDERFLNPETTMRLYKLKDKSPFNPEYPVYTLSEWLAAIYKREKEPSIDDLGNDYMGVFREMRKSGDMREEGKDAYENSLEKRLHHEVNSMVKTSQRLCYGQLSIHVPFLHQDMFTRDIENAFVTRKNLENEIRKLLEVDFSAFHREVLVRNPTAGIEREFAMKGIVPDFILSNTFGSRQFMWQDLVGKDKRSPARIILPILCSEDLETLLIDAVGALRWELCKTVLGAAWNDVTQSSITADYSDYIQFYRKNRDLSDEAKEKIKKQIQSCRNNMRDIFVSDYRFWIKYESQGVMRLNKVARGILYRHCSFTKQIRSQLEKQPIFTEIAVRFENIRNRKVTEITNRYHRYTKTGAALDPELEENLQFYRDL